MSVQYLFLMDVIYMLLKTLSARLFIALPMIIIWVFRMTKREHPCFLHLEYSTPSLIIMGIAYNIMYYFCMSGRDVLTHIF